jgi:hypothetical protein
VSNAADDKAADPNWPVDHVQDARWTGPRLIVLGLITLLIGIGVIYTSATTIGEHRNNFQELDR